MKIKVWEYSSCHYFNTHALPYFLYLLLLRPRMLCIFTSWSLQDSLFIQSYTTVWLVGSPGHLVYECFLWSKLPTSSEHTRLACNWLSLSFNKCCGYSIRTWKYLAWYLYGLVPGVPKPLLEQINGLILDIVFESGPRAEDIKNNKPAFPYPATRKPLYLSRSWSCPSPRHHNTVSA